MKIDLYFAYGLFVIFTSAILSFWYTIAGVVMILYIFITSMYYLIEKKNMSFYDIYKKIKGEK